MQLWQVAKCASARIGASILRSRIGELRSLPEQHFAPVFTAAMSSIIWAHSCSLSSFASVCALLDPEFGSHRPKSHSHPRHQNEYPPITPTTLICPAAPSAHPRRQSRRDSTERVSRLHHAEVRTFQLHDACVDTLVELLVLCFGLFVEHRQCLWMILEVSFGISSSRCIGLLLGWRVGSGLGATSCLKCST